MAKNDESVAGVIKPLAIEKMVAAPIVAAVKAQSIMNDEMLEFLDKVAVDKNGDVRMIPFAFESDEVDNEGNPNGKSRKISVDLPYLALVQPPSLAIENVEVAFDLRIHTSSNKKEKQFIKDSQGRRIEVEKDNMNIETSLTHQSANARSSDTSAKYSFKVVAKKQEQPESLSKIIDILTEASLVPKVENK